VTAGAAAARRVLRAAAALIVGALLAGCANMKLFGDASAPDPAADKPVALKTAYHVEVVAPDNLRKLLLDYLDLARFQAAPETDTMTPAELTRLAAATPAQAKALLETEGYFEADVKVLTSIRQEDELPLLRVVVEPGPRVRVVALTLRTSAGALKDAPREAAVLADLQEEFRLQPGEPFRQSEWSAAKTAALTRLRGQGYAAANWSRTAAQIDAIGRRASLELEIDSGPLFRLGALQIEGLQRYDEASVRKLSTFRPGDAYTDQLMVEYQERLQKLGLFESASVDIDADPAGAAAAPVRVRIKEMPLQGAIVGVGISANTGPRVTLEHIHRRPFGLEWVATNKFELGRDLNKWEGSLISHPLDGLYRNLVSGWVERLEDGNEVRNSVRARLGRTQDTRRIERLYFAELVRSTVDNEVTGSETAQALSGNYHWTYRDVDSVLLPTKGYTFTAESGAGYARSSTADNGPFGRLYGRITGYWPLGSAWFATVRLEAAQLFARDSVAIPDTLLFRAGGDDSVRGYDYRSLGPVVYENPDGTGAATVTSGRMLFTSSAEIARPFSLDRPEFLWAVFVDAGNAANHWRELDPALGYGVGARWRSPVGAFRVDVAYGQEVRKARLHLSVGIAF
jgi:translocation and assembly module TamA